MGSDLLTFLIQHQLLQAKLQIFEVSVGGFLTDLAGVEQARCIFFSVLITNAMSEQL